MASDPSVNTIVLMTSSQVGKTEFLLNVIGRYADLDPCPILFVLPTLVLAEDFSKDRLAPMIRDNADLLAKFGDPERQRDRSNTLLHKIFPGGHVTLAGANSPASLSSRPIRVVLCDEVDRYPFSAGTEGDPVSLAKKRSQTFWNRLTILTSTPTVKGFSRIELAYEGSDQRQFWVPCPRCGHSQVLRWAQVRWPDGKPNEAKYQCEECEERWTDAQRWGAIRKGQWIARKPFNGVVGYHLNEIYSSWVQLGDMAENFLEAKKSPETLKTFVNTSLGETWEDTGERPDSATLMDRLEEWKEVPEKVLVLTAGVDVQDDRLEVEVVGWGHSEESWSLDYRILYGDPSAPQVWHDLDNLLTEQWRTSDKRALRIAASTVDSGGHHTQQVYSYCLRNRKRRTFAVKGMAGPGRPVWPKRASKNNKARVNLFLIGVDAAKDAVYSRLKVTSPGPGFMHFPKGRDPVYFEQLTSETVVTEYVKGFPRRVWQKRPGTRNEALDVRVYAYAALAYLNVNWERLARSVEKQRGKAPAPEELKPDPMNEATHTEVDVADEEEAGDAVPLPRSRPRPTSRPQRQPLGWVNGWR